MFAMLVVVVIRWRPAGPDRDYQDLLETFARRRATTSAPSHPTSGAPSDGVRQ